MVLNQKSMVSIPIILLCSSLLLVTTLSTAADDTKTTAQSIRDGETIVSASESFRLGFFSSGTSKNRYLGIWYNKISVMTVVWIANREIPLTGSSGVLKITDQGLLVLVNHNETIIWSSNSARYARNPVAQLLDSGNLIVKDDGGNNNTEDYLWQSFDYPCDKLLPGMKLGRFKVTGLDTYLSSWKTPDDPSQGNFTYGLDLSGGYPEIVMKKDSIVRFRIGPWNGLSFSGIPKVPNPIYKYDFVLNEKEMYYTYQLFNFSLPSMVVINQNGQLQRFIWSDRIQSRMLYATAPGDYCDQYAVCGAYGSCNVIKSPVCSCLRGFVPKVLKEWDMADWSSGCVRNTSLNCSTDGFRRYSAVKLPETRTTWFNGPGLTTMSMYLDDCKYLCTKNCSCTAYANSDIRGGGSNCLLWFNDLIDIKEFDGYGQDIYIRMAASELVYDGDLKITMKSNGQKHTRIVVSSVLSTGLLFFCLALIMLWKRKQQKNRKVTGILDRSIINKGQKEDLELTLFDLGTMACATNNFSLRNKLGEGGFGPVYKVKQPCI